MIAPKLPRRSLLLLPAALLHTPVAHAADLLDRIVQARSTVRTLRARFTQDRTIGLLASSVSSRGELILVRPDRLRWHLDPPDEITWWVSRNTLSYASSTSRGTVTREAAGSMATLLDDLLAVIGGDVGLLQARYRISVRRDPDDAAVVSAVPVDADVARRARLIALVLAPDLVRPRQIVLEETAEDRSVIRFSDVRINEPVDPAIMRP